MPKGGGLVVAGISRRRWVVSCIGWVDLERFVRKRGRRILTALGYGWVVSLSGCDGAKFDGLDVVCTVV